MTPLAHLRQRLALSTEALAHLTGCNVRTAQRWLAGDAATPTAVLRLLRLVERIPAARAELERMARE